MSSGRLEATTVAAIAIVLAAAGCTSAQHTAAPAAQAVGTTAPVSAPTQPPLTCSAAASLKRPADGTTADINVSTAPQARITVVARFQTGNRKKIERADPTGLRTFWFRVGNAPPGYPVEVDVRVSANGRTRSCQASFTPRQPPPPPVPTPSPTPSPTPTTSAAAPPPAPKHQTGAWCRVTSVHTYPDSDHDEWYNDVYVQSNQPDARVTASGGGYSHSWWTDGSGNAVVYLDGPPPGTTITVTVGGATC